MFSRCVFLYQSSTHSASEYYILSIQSFFFLLAIVMNNSFKNVYVVFETYTWCYSMAGIFPIIIVKMKCERLNVVVVVSDVVWASASKIYVCEVELGKATIRHGKHGVADDDYKREWWSASLVLIWTHTTPMWIWMESLAAQTSGEKTNRLASYFIACSSKRGI